MKKLLLTTAMVAVATPAFAVFEFDLEDHNYSDIVMPIVDASCQQYNYNQVDNIINSLTHEGGFDVVLDYTCPSLNGSDSLDLTLTLAPLDAAAVIDYYNEVQTARGANVDAVRAQQAADAAREANRDAQANLIAGNQGGLRDNINNGLQTPWEYHNGINDDIEDWKDLAGGDDVYHPEYDTYYGWSQVNISGQQFINSTGAQLISEGKTRIRVKTAQDDTVWHLIDGVWEQQFDVDMGVPDYDWMGNSDFSGNGLADTVQQIRDGIDADSRQWALQQGWIDPDNKQDVDILADRQAEHDAAIAADVIKGDNRQERDDLEGEIGNGVVITGGNEIFPLDSLNKSSYQSTAWVRPAAAACWASADADDFVEDWTDLAGSVGNKVYFNFRTVSPTGNVNVHFTYVYCDTLQNQLTAAGVDIEDLRP